MQLNFPIFPEQASSMAGQVDALYLFLVLITTFFSLLIAILIVFFAIKYRRTREQQAEKIHGSNVLEIFWDVLPNRYVFTWFKATEPGTYHLFCSQYCGTKHSGMVGQVVVMTPEDYANWLASGKAEGSLASLGEKAFQQYGCTTCHRPDSGA